MDEQIIDKKVRKICVISKAVFGNYNIHDIQMNNKWTKNPYSDYATVPVDMIEEILNTKGFCDIELNEDGTEVVSFTAREIPKNSKEEKLPSTEERLQALESAMLEMVGVTE